MDSAWFSWSTGKDSAFALYEVQKDRLFDVKALLTTVTAGFDRVSMHSTRKDLLQAQSRALGIPLEIIEIPQGCTNEIYEDKFRQANTKAKAEGIEHILFGDLFLEDIRRYREKALKPTGLTPQFPLWQRDTKALAQTMIESGLEAYITCIDLRKLDRSMVGRRFDQNFLNDLPKDVDPCGENGEFHSFVAYAPNFKFPISISRGITREDKDFLFCDFTLATD